MDSHVKFGLALGRGGTSFVEGARQAEELGFDSVWSGEHVVWRHPIHDALMTLAAAAAVTSRVRVGTSILLLPLKHPVLVAKAVTTLDHVSNGRATLGIGIGGEYAKEFEAIGIPREERGVRANESIQLLKRLWTEESVTFEGRFFKLDEVGLVPKPVQRPHPPILVGGRRGSLKRTALYADGWMPYMYTPEMYRDDLAKIEEMAAGAGRDPAKIERTLYAFISIDDSYEGAAKMAAAALGTNYAQSFDKLVYRYPIIGTPEQCAERLQQFREAGAEHFILSPAGPPEKSRHFPEIIAKEIAPRFRKG